MFPHVGLNGNISVPCCPHGGNPCGFPSSPTFLFPQARTKGLRRTFDTRAIPGISRVAFGYVKTLGVRNKLISKLYQQFRVRVAPEFILSAAEGA